MLSIGFILISKIANLVGDKMNPDMNNNINEHGDLNASPPVNEAPVKRSGRKTAVIIGAVVIVALLIVGFVFKDKIISQPSRSDNTTDSVPTDPELAKFIEPTTGEKWLDEPKTISAQGWLRVEESSYYRAFEGYTIEQQLEDNRPIYQEVGTRGDKTIILASYLGDSLSGSKYLFEKHNDGKVHIIIQPQGPSDSPADWLTEAISAKVDGIDRETYYDSLNIPQKIAIDGGEYIKRPGSLFLGVGSDYVMFEGASKKLVTKLGASTVYLIEAPNVDTGLTNVAYYLETPLRTMIEMPYEPNQLLLEGYYFDNGTDVSKDSLVPIASGCGSITPSVTRADKLTESDLTIIGKTSGDRAVYRPTDLNSDLYRKAYEEYSIGRVDGVVTFDGYVANHGLVIIKNAKGELLVYIRQSYAPEMGCAKPVIYLYPTSKTKVDVKVGANVTISEPTYPASSGWQDVWAEPSGKLTYRGQVYDSLFWEGTGFGRYPNITSGTVVKRADAPATIRRQLADLGLNQKEAADFMSYWETKIPDAPYVRLTWFNTEQLNNLAPLKIVPQPDTLIRVFLDMAGFQAKIDIPEQKLSKTSRQGFTVVEWGGLTNNLGN